MAGRIRTIKPEWLENERLAACSSKARLLSVALILMADDHGRGRAAVRFITAQVWGYRDVGPDEVESALVELEEIGYVERYSIDGQEYFQIPGWLRHQRVDKPGKPRVPAPEEPVLSPRRRRVAYFIRGRETGLIKIGSSVDPARRLWELSKCGSETLDLLATGGDERALHVELAADRVHGEWFRASPAVLAKIRETAGNVREDVLASAGYVAGKRAQQFLAKVPGSLAPDHDHDHDHDRKEDQEGECEGGKLAPLVVGGKAACPGPRSKPKLLDPTKEEQVVVAGVLNRLSERTGRTYRPTTLSYARRIVRLLRAGHTERDLRLVVWDRTNDWLDNEKMNRCLRPSTLFGPEKFDEYLAEAEAAYAAKGANGRDPAADLTQPSEFTRKLLGGTR